MIELMLEASRENDEVRRASRNDLRLIEHEHWILGIADEIAFFKGSITGNSLKADDIVASLESLRCRDVYENGGLLRLDNAHDCG